MEFLLRIPDVVYSGLLASIVSLVVSSVTLCISNRAAFNRLKQQYQHDDLMEHRKFLREKIEILYLFAQEIKQDILLCTHELEYGKFLSQQDDEELRKFLNHHQQKVNSNTSKIIMIMHLYFPELMPKTESFKSSLDKFNQRIRVHLSCQDISKLHTDMSLFLQQADQLSEAMASKIYVLTSQ